MEKTLQALVSAGFWVYIQSDEDGCIVVIKRADSRGEQWEGHGEMVYDALDTAMYLMTAAGKAGLPRSPVDTRESN